ncbi:MAG: helix-turn-helix domain-containing protein [Ktedonobacteraceae bacterium]|jgi:excisionase family DNA binding protein
MEKKQNVLITDFPMLLKVEAAAKLLSLGRTKTYALIASGDLPVIRVGRAVRVPVAALHQWVEEHAKQSTSA